MESIYGHEKEHLSFSSIRLWRTNKDQYRKKYYPKDGKSTHTIYTAFGKKIAEVLEKRDFEQYPELKQIPYYSVSEHPLDVYFGNIKVVGFLDLFEPETFSIGEVKTGVPGSWNALKVRKWEQLPFYSLLVHTRYGTVDPNVRLFWLETRVREEGRILRNKEVQLTGKIEMYTRKITKAQREIQKQHILLADKEIREDYENYRRTQSIV